MNLKWRGCFLFCVCVSLLFWVAGCENRGEDFAGADDLDEVIFEQETESIQLRVYIGSDVDYHQVGNRYEFRRYSIVSIIEQYLAEHLPDVQLTIYQERVSDIWEVAEQDNEIRKEILAEMILEGNLPDIIIDFTHQIPFHVEHEIIGLDMVEQAEIQGIDLHLFEEAFIEQLRLQQEDQLYVLPLVRSLHAIRYYPDYMDEMEIPAPNERGSWEEFLAWVDEYAYQEGDDWLFNINPIAAMNRIHQQQQSIVDPSMNEVLLDREIWEKLLPFFELVYPDMPLVGGYRSNMLNEMWLTPYEDYRNLVDITAWELLPFPTFADHPGISPDYVSDIIAPSVHTNYLEEAMQVIELLVSEEFQTELSRIGLGSPLASPAVHEQLGAGTTEYEGKNIQAFFQHQPVANSLFSRQELMAFQIVYPYFLNIRHEGMDAETQLDLLLEELERTPFGGEN